MKRLRILLVKPVLPYPPDQGTRVVSFALIDALRASCDVTVLSRLLDPAEQASVSALEGLGVRVVSVVPANRRNLVARVAYKLAYHARSLVSGRSMKSLYDCPGVLIAAARALAREDFDLVIVEYWQLYPLLSVFPPARTVLLTHDIDRDVNRDRLSLLPAGFARVAAGRRARLEAREEAAAYRSSRRVLALTTRDAASVRAIAGAGTETSVLPFGLPETAFDSTPGARDSGEVLFLGAMGAAFNRDAVVHLVNDLYPELSSIPNIRFTVVGGELPPQVASFATRPGVSVPGHAPDARPYLARAACLLVPLRFAGGLRIRIIEALAAGLPVVASPEAVAGLDLEPGRHVLVAGTPGEYRVAVTRLLEDPAFAAQLSRMGQERVHEVYGPAARGDGVRGLIRGLAGASDGPAERA